MKRHTHTSKSFIPRPQSPFKFISPMANLPSKFMFSQGPLALQTLFSRGRLPLQISTRHTGHLNSLFPRHTDPFIYSSAPRTPPNQLYFNICMILFLVGCFARRFVRPSLAFLVYDTGFDESMPLTRDLRHLPTLTSYLQEI